MINKSLIFNLKIYDLLLYHLYNYIDDENHKNEIVIYDYKLKKNLIMNFFLIFFKKKTSLNINIYSLHLNIIVFNQNLNFRFNLNNFNLVLGFNRKNKLM
jgi:hypothetical protein